MSDSHRWDERFAKVDNAAPVLDLLLQHQDKLPESGTTLDLACGVSGNSIWLAQQGLSAHAWDLSGVALQKQQQWAEQEGLQISTEQRDCEQNPPEANSFDVICVSHFLYRPICTAISEALRPGGVLFYQTFNRRGSEGPSRPEFRLAEGELLGLFEALTPIWYQEDVGGKAQLIARR